MKSQDDVVFNVDLFITEKRIKNGISDQDLLFISIMEENYGNLEI